MSETDYLAWLPQIEKYAKSITKNSTNEAEDLYQEAALLIWQDREQYDPGRAAPQTWMAWKAKTAFRSLWRREQGRRDREQGMDDVSLAEGVVPRAPAMPQQVATVMLKEALVVKSKSGTIKPLARILDNIAEDRSGGSINALTCKDRATYRADYAP